MINWRSMDGMGLVDGLLWLCIIGGLLSSALALFGRWYTLPSFLTGPVICQTEAGGCQILFRTRQAALLGIPNAVLGLFFYGSLSFGLWRHWSLWILWTGSWMAFLMSLWLGWFLLRHRLECRICWAGHACNVSVWLILWTKMF